MSQLKVAHFIVLNVCTGLAKGSQWLDSTGRLTRVWLVGLSQRLALVCALVYYSSTCIRVSCIKIAYFFHTRRAALADR
jgi:hypothetical protein